MSTLFQARPKKDRCPKGSCVAVPFTAKNGEQFHRCQTCDNLVNMKAQGCGHKETETAISQSEANKGREYLKCTKCFQFCGWKDGASSSSARQPNNVDYVTREEFDRLAATVTSLITQLQPVSVEYSQALSPPSKRAKTN